MGIQWSRAKLVKGDTTFMKTAEIPVNAPGLWDLWKTYKTEIKADGFGVSTYNDKWRVSYFELANGRDMDDIESGFAVKVRKYELLIGA